MIPHPPRSTLSPNATPFRSALLSTAPPPPPPWPPGRALGRQPLDQYQQSVTLLLHRPKTAAQFGQLGGGDRKSTRLNSSHANISYAVFCLNKKKSPTRQPPV